MEFIEFKNAVAKKFKTMCSYPLYRTAVSKDTLWDTYLQSFPEGSNPIYKERTEHDCNCCKQFIRAVGDVVAIIDNKLVSIWEFDEFVVPEYQAVANALAKAVKSHEITDVFLHYERTAGTDKNFQDTVEGVKTWNHFFVNIPAASVVRGEQIATRLGDARSLHGVFYRALIEFKSDVIDTVLELIAQNSLYRGEEHKGTLVSFQKCLKMLGDASPEETWIKAWEWLSLPQSVTRIRNTSIGTLLTSLSEGKELEDAVKSFEAMVAPANYKRPTALVTKAMVDKAKAQIEVLGLTSALQRRYATLNDITINNSLFVNRSTRAKIEKDVFDTLSKTATTNPRKTLSKVEEISIDDFLLNVVPKVESIEVLLENAHANNLVSLLTAADPTASQIFKWDNPFSWSYNGDVTDSIKERVKAAGGNVTGDLCCRLAWSNRDDLDLHMVEPDGHRIYYVNRRQLSNCGGMLDLDANGADGLRKDPAENIFYKDKRKMKQGKYKLTVNQYFQRDTSDVGFQAEIEFMGELYLFEYPQVVRGNVLVAEFEYTHADGVKILKGLPAASMSKRVWNLDTAMFHKVNVLMLSPNYWSDCVASGCDAQGVGNKHYFFLLDQCRNEGTARGLYNEFLRNDLNEHRKVFEMVGSKLRSDEELEQLSGIGFSTTKRASLLCRVGGNFTRNLLIKF